MICQCLFVTGEGHVILSALGWQLLRAHAYIHSNRKQHWFHTHVCTHTHLSSQYRWPLVTAASMETHYAHYATTPDVQLWVASHGNERDQKDSVYPNLPQVLGQFQFRFKYTPDNPTNPPQREQNSRTQFNLAVMNFSWGSTYCIYIESSSRVSQIRWYYHPTLLSSCPSAFDFFCSLSVKSPRITLCRSN